MGLPRRIIPGVTYLVTRRCSQRAFRLVPTPQLNAIMKYSLALALEKSGVLLHAVCAMSNHIHLVVTDARGELPTFLREFHRSTAKAINALQRKRENLWASEPCSAIVLGDEDAIIEKIAYVAANPVAAGLVREPRKWPGLILWKRSKQIAYRPNVYFSEKGRSPPRLMLRTAWAGQRGSSLKRRIAAAISARVSEIRASMLRSGARFVGRARVLAQSISEVASVPEVFGSRPTPVVASNDAIRENLLYAYSSFHSAYRIALEKWCAGDRAALFPSGTWWLRVHHHARASNEYGGDPIARVA